MDQLDKLLLELKIVSNLKEYDKLDVSTDENLKIDRPHILQGFSRMYSGNGREKTLAHLDNLIDKIFRITDQLLETEIKNKKPISTLHIVNEDNNNGIFINKNLELEKIQFKDDLITIYQNINQHLSTSIDGLQNLKITYLNDVSTTSKLDMLIIKIHNRINKIKDMMTLKN